MATRHEGLATRVPFELTTSILREVLDDFVLVSDDEIDEAICLLAEKAKLDAEGAGAASLAAALKLRDGLAGEKVVGILSGGNIPLERLCDLCRNRRNQRDATAQRGHPQVQGA
jgi:threonine dehydratase